MKILKLIIFLMITTILLCSCPEETRQEFIHIVNKSDKKIAFQIAKNEFNETFYCSDVGRTIFISVENNSSFKLDDGDAHSSWSTNLQSLTVFILDGELYEEYWRQPCDTICKYVPILHTYQLTLEDLQRMNWTVTYPPEE